MPTTRMRVAALVLCVAGWVAGCGGGVEIEELDEAFIDAFCERYVRCGEFESSDACHAAFSVLASGLVELQHAVAGGSVIYDGDAMGTCMDALGAASCDRTSESVRVDAPTCREAIRGTVADGAPCLIGAQCISGACSNADCPMACCEGTCQPVAADVPLGGACARGESRCVEGAFCNLAQICQALRGPGEQCFASSECGYGLRCSDLPGECVDAPNRGEACPEGGCVDLGTLCSDSGVCVGLPKRGQPCGPLETCQAPNLCDRATTTCIPPPAIGQPCEGTCALGSYCAPETQTCAAEKAEGAACASDEQCATQFCDEATSQCLRRPVCL